MQHKIILSALLQERSDSWTWDCECGHLDPFFWASEEGCLTAYAEHVLQAALPEGWVVGALDVVREG